MRRDMTPQWKANVLARLAENHKRGVHPRTQAELAEAVGLSKSGLGRLFDPRRNQTASAFVDPISTTLRLSVPLRDLTAMPETPPKKPEAANDSNRPAPDELDEAIRWIPEVERSRAAAILRAVFGPPPRTK